MDENRGLDHLEIWQAAMNFTVNILQKIIPCLPPEEKWALASQLRRSAQSIPANIAEGYGRYYFTENVRFCYIARGSLEETYSHLVLANRLGYLPASELQSCNAETIRLRQLLHGYIAFLKRSKRGENEPGATTRIRESQESYFYNDDSPDNFAEDRSQFIDLSDYESTSHESTNADSSTREIG